MDTSSIHHDIAAVSRISAVPSILKVVAELTGMRVTLVARVTNDNWTACAVYDRMDFGLRIGDQLDVTTTLCKEVHESGRAIVVENAKTDPIYRNHHTPKLYKIDSYIAIPILRPNGSVFGTLCAIDRLPAKLEPKVVASLALFSELIARQLRDEEERTEMEQALWDERKISQLREQFIAVLGHDLRTPLGAITASADALLEQEPKPGQLGILGGIHESCRQMGRLVEDVLDFARGRLGGGILVQKRPVADLRTLLKESIAELARAHGGRLIQLEAAGPIPAMVDEVRFRQLISNLLGNALQHSPVTERVVARADMVAGIVRISITNGGTPLPPEMVGNVFAPFHRAKTDRRKGGLGLGLYIASEIARAHGGSLQAESDLRSTTFTIMLPAGGTAGGV